MITYMIPTTLGPLCERGDNDCVHASCQELCVSQLRRSMQVKGAALVVMQMIAEDRASGLITPDMFTFSRLHDVTDANVYLLDAVRAPDKFPGDSAEYRDDWEAYMDICNAVSDHVNDRMVGAEIRKGRREDETGVVILTQCSHRLSFPTITDPHYFADLSIECHCGMVVMLDKFPMDPRVMIVYASWTGAYILHGGTADISLKGDAS